MGTTTKIILFLIFTLCVFSCTKTVYIPQKEIQYETVIANHYRVDSISFRDTVKVIERGICKDSIVTQWRERFTVIKDTVSIERNDTTVITIERVPEGYKKITWLDTALRYAGIAAILVFVGWLFYILIRYKLKR